MTYAERDRAVEILLDLRRANARALPIKVNAESLSAILELARVTAECAGERQAVEFSPYVADLCSRLVAANLKPAPIDWSIVWKLSGIVAAVAAFWLAIVRFFRCG